MKSVNWKKLILPNLPYLLFVYLFDKVAQAARLAPGADFSGKLLSIGNGFTAAFSSFAPSFNPVDLLVGVAGAVLIRLIVYFKGKNAKKYRKGVEYGSARWGNAEDIKPYIDPVFENNVLLTQTERLMMNSRPKQPKHARNKNVLVIGGSGSGKTRFFVKPNLMQMHSSYVVTDPKGTVLIECGKLLQRGGYRIKVLNTINFKKSMRYNPFAYIRDEKDILKLVNTLIANTKGSGEKSGEDFWVKAERLFYCALIGYIHYEAPEAEKNFTTLLEMINEFYARDTSKKIRAVKQAKAQKGERVNGEVPYGYIADPDDRNHLIPDPETAHVVKQIFAMYVRGDRICEIQNWLRDNKILTVGELRYRRTGSTRHPRPQLEAYYNWPDKTLYDILARKEYLGHTITGKTRKVSYKSKKTLKNPEDKQYFFPNTHEALIDEETFDLAQKRIATKQRPTKVDEIDLFSGILFCGDCGYKMYAIRGAGTLERKHAYTCGNYRNRARNDFVCTTHYIRKPVLKELVLADLQRVMSYVQEREQEFIRTANEYSDQAMKKALSQQQKELDKAEKRINELDILFRKLYENNICQG